MWDRNRMDLVRGDLREDRQGERGLRKCFGHRKGAGSAQRICVGRLEMDRNWIMDADGDARNSQTGPQLISGLGCDGVDMITWSRPAVGGSHDIDFIEQRDRRPRRFRAASRSSSSNGAA